jgi:hypothetical protein
MKRFAVENAALPGCSSIPIAGAVRAGEQVITAARRHARRRYGLRPGDAAGRPMRRSWLSSAAGGALTNLTG